MYLSIDIETTGLKPECHQVLEVAAVLDWDRPLMDCPTFHMIVDPGDIVGTPYALAMNAELLRAIADGDGVRPLTFTDRFHDWLMCNGVSPDNKVTLLGKNVASFDWQFLRRMPSFPTACVNYRFLDIGSLYATRDGIDGQSELADVLAKDLDIPGKPHEALYDARVSLALARLKWGITA